MSYTGGDGNDVTLTRVANLVVDRKLFYDQERVRRQCSRAQRQRRRRDRHRQDGLPPNGTLAGFANVSSYSRGINGIMIDLAGGGNHAAISAADFVFKTGNNNSPGSWVTLTATATVSVRAGQGTGGSDRVEITWASGQISNTWLEVQVLANGTTNAVTTDVHFWGNKIGDTGLGTPPATTFFTSGLDKTAVLGLTGAAGGVTNIHDFNRDNIVSGIDASIVTGSLGSIIRLQIGPGGPFAPEGDSGVASALAAAATGTGVSPATATVFGGMPAADLPTSPEVAAPRKATGQFAGALDLVLLAFHVADEEFDLDDELISSLLAN